MGQISSIYGHPLFARKKKKNRGNQAYKKKIREERKKGGFYRSQEWLELRYKALVKHGRRCACCGAKASDGVTLHVDHIMPRSKFPHLELRLDNLQVLCEQCNVGKSNKHFDDFREVKE